MNKKSVHNMNEVHLENKPGNSTKDFMNTLKYILGEDKTRCKEVCPDKNIIIDLYASRRNKDASTTISRTAFKEIFTECFDELAEVFKSYVAAKKVDESCTCKLDRGIPARAYQSYKLNYLSVSNKGTGEKKWNNVENTLTQYSEQNMHQHNVTPELVDAAIQSPYLDKKDQIIECQERSYFKIDTSTDIRKNLEDTDSIEALLIQNTRLQRAVKKLTSIRQREKQNTPWRGFINELRSKHNYGVQVYPPYCCCCNSEDDDIFSNEKLNTSSSYVGKKLVKNVYNDLPPTNYASGQNNIDFSRENNTSLNNCRYCGPNVYRDYNVVHKYNREKPVIIDDYVEVAEDFDIRNLNTNLKYDYNVHDKNNREKVPFAKSNVRDYDEKIENARRKLNNTILKCDKLRADIKPKRKNNTLTNIESKLDHLIKSIDLFILEIKSSKNADVCKLEMNKNNASSRSEFNALTDFEEALCGNFSTFSLSKKTGHSQENCTEKPKSIIDNDFKKDVRSTTNIPSQFTANQRSTETSTSLIVAPLSHGDEKNITTDKTKRQRECYKHLVNIAINTDPLGLFALLKISSESIKQLLSMMPTLNYLPMLQYSDDKKTEDTKLTCKVCGAHFSSPAELSKHIFEHTLGAVRDCCVCRQIVQLKTYRGTRLFTCGHCGQKFTRAYCCQLHQQDCARKLGRPTDDKDSLLILR